MERVNYQFACSLMSHHYPIVDYPDLVYPFIYLFLELLSVFLSIILCIKCIFACRSFFFGCPFFEEKHHVAFVA